MKFILFLTVVLFPVTLLAQAPVISSFLPTSAPSGATVTITGTDFTDATDVSFGGTAAASFTVDSPTQILAVVANGASGSVSVTTPGGTDSFAGFTFIAGPTISSFAPISAISGATVTITGTDFDGATAVSFGGTAATSFNVVNSTTVTAVVATGSSGNVSVTTPGGNAVLGGFTFIAAPTISSFTPNSGAQGINVTISGTNFTGATSVKFGGTEAASFIINSPTSINAVVATGSTGTISVTNPAGSATSSGSFTLLPLATITGINPTSGAIGSTIQMDGSNFNSTAPYVTSVRFFNNVTASSFAVVGNGSRINSIIVPVGATTGPISVTVNGVTVVSSTFTVIPPPAVTSFNPTNAGSGTTVTISGTNFTGATAVSFGGTSASSFSVVNATTITAVVAGGTSGSVSVTTPGGVATLGGFTFIPSPTISSFTPTSAGTGVTVTIAGSNFSNTSAVSFGSTPAASFNIDNPNQISAVVAGGSSGSVSVTTPGGTTTRTGFTFDNIDPTVVVSSTAAEPTNVSPIPVTITFSENVTGFVAGDITVTNGTVGNFAGNNNVYTANITPTAAGPVTVSVAANAANDAATNGNIVSNVLSRTYDNIAPTVIITTSATEPTSFSPIPITITFSESVTGLVVGDITVTNGTAGSFTGSGTTYNASITPTAAGLVTVSVPANKAVDAATNSNTASNTLSRTYDNVQPTVVITSSATDPTNASPIPVTINFSEVVTGFEVGEITVTNGTADGFAGSGSTYTANITPTSEGPVTVSIAANVAVDVTNNENTASNTLSRTYDTVQPTVVINSTAIDPTNASPIPVTITFSESVTGLVVGDITVTNGTVGSFTGSGTTYNASITPTAAGLVTVSVPANKAVDAATNSNTASNTLSRTYDNIQPTVVITSIATDPTNASPIPFTITFSESVTGFAVGDITVTNGTAGSFTGSGATYTASITPSAAGLVTISVPVNVAVDAATNSNTASNTLSKTYDNARPTVVITSTTTDPTNASPIPVTITFSESVTGFAVGDITVTNGTAGSFTGSGATYTASITPTAAGLLTVSVPANVAVDATTNSNTASNTLSRTYDNVQPTVVITSTATDPTNASPIPVTITFSGSVTGFIADDITVNNGTIGSFTGSGTTYTTSITPSAAGLVTISVPANVAVDAATNSNTASNTLSRTYDNIQPTVVITSTATDPTNASPIPVTITFSGSVTGFIADDITVNNGTIGSFTGSGTTYTTSITPSAAGLVTISVPANVAVDAATNSNTASNTLSRTYDNIQPTVVITSIATDPTNASPIPFTITFSESVTGFAVGDITVTNGTAGSFTGSGTTYAASITPTAAGLLTVSVPANKAVDAATNSNTASNTLSKTYDNVRPTVVITSTATDPTNSSPIPVTITFNESVTGFAVGDITVTNGTAGSFTGSGTTYTASITPTAAGLVTVSVPANVAVDAATNSNTASNTLSRTYDNIQPTVVITSTATDPTNASPIPVTITFSGSVTGFIADDITVNNGTIGSFTGSGTTYTASITPTAAGLVSVSVPANVAVDAATNSNAASNTLSRTYDNVKPTVVITSTATDPTNASPIPVTITFSESVTGFAVGDITVTNGTAGSFTGSGTIYAASITPTAAGLVTVSVPANKAADAATNSNTASNTLSRTYDNARPTVAITSTATDPTNTSPIPVTITFSESVTGFIADDITVTNGTAGSFTGSGTTYVASITPSAEGLVTVSVPANVAVDAATNGNIGSAAGFTFSPTTITSFTPISGAVGTSVTITGTNFITTPVVAFNGISAIVIASSTTSITTSVPSGAGTGPISVTVNGVKINSSSNFTIYGTPSITGFNPTVGAHGAIVTISGSDFSSVPAENTVKFNGTTGVVSASTTSSITTSVPFGAITGPISVTVNGINGSSSTNFTVLPTPTITNFTPSGAVSATVIISGTNFNTIPINNIVMFNGIPSVVTNSTSTTITTTVPAGATTGKISLTLNNITVISNTDFTVLPTPTFTDFSPLSGAAGAIVVISGTNFSTIPSDNVVKFNEVTAEVKGSTPTSITVIVPVGASTGRITIKVSGITITSATNFIVMPTPQITDFSPTSGVVGATINITGLNFDSDEVDNVVTFNGTTAIVEASSTTSIITKVPAGATSGKISVNVNGVTVYSTLDFTVLQIIPDDTTPPLLSTNNTPAEVIQGSNLVISAQFTDPETKILSALVKVISPSSGTEINTSLTLSGNNYEFTVPSLLIGELGVEYEFNVTNEKGLVYTSPTFLAKVRIPGTGLTIPYTSFGSNISNYRIISVPLDLDKPSVTDVFDELPLYDKTMWRISHYDNTTNTNKELLTSNSLQPGLGYWILIKDNPAKPITTGTGKTVAALPVFSIPLKAGWNQIGNPYNFNLLWSDLVTANPGLPISFRSYNGSIKNFENKTTLNIMEGGFINVATDMNLVYPAKKNTGSRIESQQGPLENSIDQTDWEVDFTINQGDISNVIGGVGMRLNASEDFDIYDGFSMPHFDEFLDLNHTKKLNQYNYSKDVIHSTESHTWDFKVDASNTEKPATITWNNSYLGTNNINLILFDEKSNVWINMKQHSSFSFTPPVNFKVIYGSENYVAKEVGNGDAKILEVSPNPANGPISIHMFLPDWQKKFPVQLDLKSLTGITVANIFSGELESGYQKIVWSGESNSTKLPSGVYLVQMRSNNAIQTVRLLLVN